MFLTAPVQYLFSGPKTEMEEAVQFLAAQGLDVALWPDSRARATRNDPRDLFALLLSSKVLASHESHGGKLHWEQSG